jgi:type I restriction enzyme R subunit
MAFNENTRVKIPAILHLVRLGYKYLPLNKAKWDKSSNIFTDIFLENIKRLNPDLDQQVIEKILETLSLKLDNDDLGQEFYRLITASSGVKIIDFTNFENNSFHVITELPYKNGEEEFRPDITLLINGLPLVFIEVKKPNNEEGILAERDRINVRFKNRKFKRFINVTQLLLFTNNMEYDTESIVPIQGAFYENPYAKQPLNILEKKQYEPYTARLNIRGKSIILELCNELGDYRHDRFSHWSFPYNLSRMASIKRTIPQTKGSSNITQKL